MSSETDVAAGQGALRAMRTDDAIAAFNRAIAIDPENIAAHLGLYEAYQIKGDRERALEHQTRALAKQRLFLEKPAPSGAPTVLLVAIPGDWQANVPLEFLYGSLNVGIIKMYVDDIDPLPPRDILPPFDVIFNLIAHSEQSGPTLKVLEGWLPSLGSPFLNDPARVRTAQP